MAVETEAGMQAHLAVLSTGVEPDHRPGLLAEGKGAEDAANMLVSPLTDGLATPERGDLVQADGTAPRGCCDIPCACAAHIAETVHRLCHFSQFHW
jgi:hypothetical protein